MAIRFMPQPDVKTEYEIGDRVIKTGGDYVFEGEVRGIIFKRSGALRYAVEDNRGVLMVMNERQLERVRL